jgi:hypothetical protein
LISERSLFRSECGDNFSGRPKWSLLSRNASWHRRTMSTVDEIMQHIRR